MWDEKKFFDDYVSETDKIKPDSDFIKELKVTMENETGSYRRYVLPGYGIIIAAVLLIFAGLGIWWAGGGKSISENDTKKPKSYAEKNGQMQSGEVSVLTLKTAIECLDGKESVVTDKMGGVISKDKKKELAGMLKNAVSTDYKPTGEEKYDVYKCSGSAVFSLDVYDSGYVIIEETGMVYKVEQ